MDIAIIAGLLLLGVILFLLEIFLIPGISIAAVGGVLATVGAVAYAYMRVGFWAGHLTFIISALLLALCIYFVMKSGTMDNLSLKSNIDSSVDVMQDVHVSIGDKGKTISRLAPMGKVEVNGNTMEAKTMDEFIDEDTEIEVLKVYSNSVLVRKTTNS
ncbi:MAG: NfeD family protein [Paludibacteraceae bacterium]|nr:NfeD family protein [Paludibacteraceae bacterium]HOU68842.1 NfeD family protein [Paludibacteraceae bacterium]HQF50740.1 NfeD family protein [Paludibacteraceae bacterium]